jgi:hypothetical protein
MGQQRVRHNRATWAMALVNWHLRVYRMVRYEPADSGLAALDVSSPGASAKEAPKMPVLADPNSTLPCLCLVHSLRP